MKKTKQRRKKQCFQMLSETYKENWISHVYVWYTKHRRTI